MIAKDSQKIEKVYLRIVKRPSKFDGVRNDRKKDSRNKKIRAMFLSYMITNKLTKRNWWRILRFNW
jgi:hypothetical protein